MDTQNNDKAHNVEPVASTYTHTELQDTDELLKEKEDELLYETGEDGEEEEALSDDSVRLRVSDDEVEVEEIVSDIYLGEQPNKKAKFETITSDNQQKSSINEHKTVIKNDIKNNGGYQTDTALEKHYDIHKSDIINSLLVPAAVTKDVTYHDIVICDDEINDKLDGEVTENLSEPKCNVQIVEDNTKVSDKNESSKLPCNDITTVNNKICKTDVKKSIDHSSSQDVITVTSELCDSKDTVPSSETKFFNDEVKDKLDPNTKKENHALLEQDPANCIKAKKKVVEAKLPENEPLVIDNCKKSVSNHVEIQRSSVDKNCTVNETCETRKETDTVQNIKSPRHENDKSNTSSANLIEKQNNAVHNNLVVEKNLNNQTTDTEGSSKKRRSRQLGLAERDIIAQEKNSETEAGRPKRRTAKNAEEIIRKKFLNQDSDVESSDGSEKLVPINHKINQHTRSLSPPTLKRNCPDNDNVVVNGNTKKVKTSEVESVSTKQSRISEIKNLNYVHKFFRRDLKGKLPKLTQEELEELLIQKIVETITMKSEIGRLREQARISERNQEMTRTRCQQLAKQIKDFEMVLTRNAADRRANNDKPIPPIKINRSVGLQVNFTTEHGIQNLRQLQQNSNPKPADVSNGINTSLSETPTNSVNPRRIKVRSPRRTAANTMVAQPLTTSPNLIQTSIAATITPATLVVQKAVDSKQSLNPQNQTNTIQQSQQQQQQQTQQPSTVVLNGKLPNHGTRQNVMANASKTKSNDLIDLTDEEEKNKSTPKSKPAVAILPATTISTTTNTDQTTQNIVSKAQACFPRVIQTLATSVAITTQPGGGIRLVQPVNHPSPAAIVNNLTAPRLTYVMQSGPPRQLLITSNSNPIRPTTSCNRPPFTTLTYKTGASTIANGTVRLITTSAGPNVQQSKHPAPLPDIPHYAVNTVWKLPPPAPSLKISKVPSGIVLSWNMALSDKHADIVSYQLYAYQEVAGIPPSTSLWKKVGDVRALPLPMACTLTQFSEGNKYYFAVRAVDTHSRKGQYSVPGNISL